MPQGFCHSARRNWTSSSDIIDFPEGEKSFSYAPGKGGIQMIRLKTSKGDILLEMFEKEAPKTVENFVNYVKAGHYEGTIFHRVIDGFMIQGGGFDETMQQKPTGTPIENEASNGLGNEAYTVAMARTQDPHSATAQFFINVTLFKNCLQDGIAGVVIFYYGLFWHFSQFKKRTGGLHQQHQYGQLGFVSSFVYRFGEPVITFFQGFLHIAVIKLPVGIEFMLEPG